MTTPAGGESLSRVGRASGGPAAGDKPESLAALSVSGAGAAGSGSGSEERRDGRRAGESSRDPTSSERRDSDAGLGLRRRVEPQRVRPGRPCRAGCLSERRRRTSESVRTLCRGPGSAGGRARVPSRRRRHRRRASAATGPAGANSTAERIRRPPGPTSTARRIDDDSKIRVARRRRDVLAQYFSR